MFKMKLCCIFRITARIYSDFISWWLVEPHGQECDIEVRLKLTQLFLVLLSISYASMVAHELQQRNGNAIFRHQISVGFVKSPETMWPGLF